MRDAMAKHTFAHYHDDVRLFRGWGGRFCNHYHNQSDFGGECNHVDNAASYPHHTDILQIAISRWQCRKLVTPRMMRIVWTRSI